MDLERWSTQGCEVSGLFVNKRGGGAHELVAATLKILFFKFFVPSHPSSSRPSAAP